VEWPADPWIVAAALALGSGAVAAVRIRSWARGADPSESRRVVEGVALAVAGVGLVMTTTGAGGPGALLAVWGLSLGLAVVVARAWVAAKRGRARDD
jgi:hypothetical protein